MKFVENNCDVGLAFDGDADRFWQSMKRSLVDGDRMLSIIGLNMKMDS